MSPIQSKKSDDKEQKIDAAVARVEGAAAVARAAVAATMVLNNEAMDYVESLKKPNK